MAILKTSWPAPPKEVQKQVIKEELKKEEIFEEEVSAEEIIASLPKKPKSKKYKIVE